MTMTQKEAQQHIFDLALNHIRNQGRPSLAATRGCAYRGVGGLSCAFAPAIKDYTKGMEGCSASGLIQDHPESLIPEAVISGVCLCDSIQYCHDGSSRSEHFMTDFERRMKNVASDYGLVYMESVCDE